MHDQEGRHNDHDALEHCAEKLGLVVPVRMIGVRRPYGHLDCDEGGDCGRNIYSAFQRIRQQGDGPRHLPCKRLKSQHENSDKQAADCEFSGYGEAAHAAVGPRTDMVGALAEGLAGDQP